GGGGGEDGQVLARAGAAVVVCGVGVLRPPIGFVGDAVLGRGHAGSVDAARGPGRRAARRRNGGRRRHPPGGGRGGRRRGNGPRLSRPPAAVVVCGVGVLRPPIGFVGDAVLGRGHAGSVDAARGPGRRAARRRNGGRRRHRRDGGRWARRRDNGPRLSRPEAAIVVRGVGAF